MSWSVKRLRDGSMIGLQCHLKLHPVVTVSFPNVSASQQTGEGGLSGWVLGPKAMHESASPSQPKSVP